MARVRVGPPRPPTKRSTSLVAQKPKGWEGGEDEHSAGSNHQLLPPHTPASLSPAGHLLEPAPGTMRMLLPPALVTLYDTRPESQPPTNVCGLQKCTIQHWWFSGRILTSQKYTIQVTHAVKKRKKERKEIIKYPVCRGTEGYLILSFPFLPFAHSPVAATLNREACVPLEGP